MSYTSVSASVHACCHGLLESLVELARELGLSGQVRFLPSVPVEQILLLMAVADVGIVPKVASGFGNEAYSTKLMEFMATGIPAVVFRTQIDTQYSDDTIVRLLDTGGAEDLADATNDVLRHQNRSRALVRQAAASVLQNCRRKRHHEYCQLVDTLCRCPVHYRATSSQSATVAKYPSAPPVTLMSHSERCSE